MRIHVLGAATILVCASLSAQINNPNGASVFGTPALFPPLGGMNGGIVAQLELTPMPGGPSTMYYVAATVSGQVGNAGNYDIQCGTYDAATQTYTPNNDAASLNSSGAEFQFSVSNDLLFAVFDTPGSNPIGNGNAAFATRASTTAAWNGVGQIGGVPTGYIDPVLSTYNGQDVILYISGQGIAMADIDRTTGQISNARWAAQLPQNVNAIYSQLHSPGPLEVNGTMVGMFCSGQNGGDSDILYSPLVGYSGSASQAPGGLEPQVVFEELSASGNVWLANPAPVGGTLYAARAQGGYGDPLEIKSCVLAGSEVNAGMAEVNLSYPEVPAGGAGLVGILFGIPQTNPISLRLLTGTLQVIPAVSTPTLPAAPGQVNTQVQIPVPAGTPSGTLFAQGFYYDPVANTINMSNLAGITN